MAKFIRHASYIHSSVKRSDIKPIKAFIRNYAVGVNIPQDINGNKGNEDNTYLTRAESTFHVNIFINARLLNKQK